MFVHVGFAWLCVCECSKCRFLNFNKIKYKANKFDNIDSEVYKFRLLTILI